METIDYIEPSDKINNLSCPLIPSETTIIPNIFAFKRVNY